MPTQWENKLAADKCVSDQCFSTKYLVFFSQRHIRFGPYIKSQETKKRQKLQFQKFFISHHFLFKWSQFERILGPNQQLDTFNGIFCAFSWVDFKTNMLKSIQHFAWGAMSTVQLLDCSSVMHEKVEERKKTNEYRTFAVLPTFARKKDIFVKLVNHLIASSLFHNPDT